MKEEGRGGEAMNEEGRGVEGVERRGELEKRKMIDRIEELELWMMKEREGKRREEG